MVLLSHAPSAASFLVAGLLEGAGGGRSIPMMLALLAARFYPYERARMFSVCIGGFDVGIAIAEPVLGAFAEQLGYQGIFSLTTGIALLAFIVFIRLNSKNLSHSLCFATGRGRDVYAFHKTTLVIPKVSITIHPMNATYSPSSTQHSHLLSAKFVRSIANRIIVARVRTPIIGAALAKLIVEAPAIRTPTGMAMSRSKILLPSTLARLIRAC